MKNCACVQSILNLCTMTVHFITLLHYCLNHRSFHHYILVSPSSTQFSLKCTYIYVYICKYRSALVCFRNPGQLLHAPSINCWHIVTQNGTVVRELASELKCMISCYKIGCKSRSCSWFSRSALMYISYLATH